MTAAELETALEEVSALLDRGDVGRATKAMPAAEAIARGVLDDRAAPSETRAEVALAVGELWFELGELAPAAQWLTRAAEVAAGDGEEEGAIRADALHTLGMIYDEQGDHARRAEAWLQVAALDARGELPAWVLSPEAFHDEAEAAMGELAEVVQRKLAHNQVPILIEDAPNPTMVGEGVDPRVLGIFEGAPLAEHGAVAAPTLIRLFRTNIAAASEDEEDMREQVRITVWHETAHYFGLDDAQLEELGLG